MANVVLVKVLKITRRLNLVVSRPGLEPRALALKAPRMIKKINAMTLQNRPMSDKHLQRVTVCVSYIGQSPSSLRSVVYEMQR